MKIIKKIFGKKRAIYWIFAVIVISFTIFFIFQNGNGEDGFLIVRSGDFLRQASVSGKAVASSNVELSFEQSGRVENIFIKESDEVKTGQILAEQDLFQLFSQLAEAEAEVDLQEAKLSQLLAGSSGEDIAVSENSVALAKQNLDSAYNNALTNMDGALNAVTNADSAVIYLRSNYFSLHDQEGLRLITNEEIIARRMTDIRVSSDSAKKSFSAENTETAIVNTIDGLNDVFAALTIIREQCDSGIYYFSIPSSEKSSLDTQKSNINSFLAKIRGSQQDIFDYKISLKKAESELAAIKAPARDTDVAIHNAQVQKARAAAKTVLTQIEKRKIRAPFDGIVIKVDAKKGGILAANEAAISLMGSNSLEIESYVPEIYVPFVMQGNRAEVIFDAYGDEKIFEAIVVSIAPAETIRDGVSTYKTKLMLKKEDNFVKPGMTANVLITTEKRSNVFSVPQKTVFSKNGKKFIKMKENDSVIEKEVKIGSVSSSGQVEILSGIKEGDMVLAQP